MPLNPNQPSFELLYPVIATTGCMRIKSGDLISDLVDLSSGKTRRDRQTDRQTDGVHRYIVAPHPRTGSGAVCVRIDRLRLLAGCRKRRPIQALSVLSLRLFLVCPLCCQQGSHFALCYFVLFVCFVSWLFLLGCQYK